MVPLPPLQPHLSLATELCRSPLLPDLSITLSFHSYSTLILVKVFLPRV